MMNFSSLIHEFEQSNFFKYIGFECVSVEYGKVIIQIQKRPDISNLKDMLHGGVIMSGLDIVMGITSRTLGVKAASTIQMEVKFVNSVFEGTTEIIGELIHRSDHTAILNGKVIDDQGNLIAYSTATFRLYS
ncbi:PaaI family thioesterase [Psychrobacillus sp. NPDC093180]|uniref:PaaI family thioesterase n=1 Tax=Psychrobacillus sp. NPDC093180 TaxID=3364489 RepID=UPI00381366DF